MVTQIEHCLMGSYLILVYRGFIFYILNLTLPSNRTILTNCVQVCQLLSVGNWTLERDEDLTGPYAFLGNKWIAFDDDTSLKIKAKYVLLRDLAGVGLMSVDADDIDNVCGKVRL